MRSGDTADSSTATRKRLEEIRQKRAAQVLKPPPPFAAPPAFRQNFSSHPPYENLPAQPQIGSNVFHGVNTKHLHVAESATSLRKENSSGHNISKENVSASALWDRIHALENDLHQSQMELKKSNDNLSLEQQRSGALASEIANIEVERLSWTKERREDQNKILSIQKELVIAQAQLQKSEEQLIVAKKSAELAGIERDAAVSAKEDAVSQLRVTKSRLREAEDELYKAEEDMAALREELRAQQAEAGVAAVDQSGLRVVQESLRLAEQERDAFQADIKVLELELQAEQRKLASESHRLAALQLEKDEVKKALDAAIAEMEDLKAALKAKSLKLEADTVLQDTTAQPWQSLAVLPSATGSSIETDKTAMGQKEAQVGTLPAGLSGEFSESPMEPTNQHPILQEENKVLLGLKQSLEAENAKQSTQVMQLLAAVEKLDKSREKLFTEVDAQSVQIERLFMENSGLIAGLKETAEISAHWEAQAKAAIRDVEQLRVETRELRHELENVLLHKHSQGSTAMDSSVAYGNSGTSEDVAGAEHSNAANLKLKAELLALRTQNDDAKSQLIKLTSDYTQAVQTLNNYRRLCKVVLGNVETKLRNVRQDFDGSL